MSGSHRLNGHVGGRPTSPGSVQNGAASEARRTGNGREQALAYLRSLSTRPRTVRLQVAMTEPFDDPLTTNRSPACPAGESGISPPLTETRLELEVLEDQHVTVRFNSIGVVELLCPRVCPWGTMQSIHITLAPGGTIIVSLAFHDFPTGIRICSAST